MSIYTTAAIVGGASFVVGATVVAVSLGGGAGSGGGAGLSASASVYDVRLPAYMAQMQYAGGGAALVPLSLALRVESVSDGKAVCRELNKAERAVRGVLRKEITPNFNWAKIERSGVDQRLRTAVNRAIGDDAVTEVLIEAGDVTLSGNLVSCLTMSRK